MDSEEGLASGKAKTILRMESTTTMSSIWSWPKIRNNRHRSSRMRSPSSTADSRGITSAGMHALPQPVCKMIKRLFVPTPLLALYRTLYAPIESVRRQYGPGIRIQPCRTRTIFENVISCSCHASKPIAISSCSSSSLVKKFRHEQPHQPMSDANQFKIIALSKSGPRHRPAFRPPQLCLCQVLTRLPRHRI